MVMGDTVTKQPCSVYTIGPSSYTNQSDQCSLEWSGDDVTECSRVFECALVVVYKIRLNNALNSM